MQPDAALLAGLSEWRAKPSRTDIMLQSHNIFSQMLGPARNKSHNCFCGLARKGAGRPLPAGAGENSDNKACGTFPVRKEGAENRGITSVLRPYGRCEGKRGSFRMSQ
ncbi:hypothetical protein JCM14124_30700 [Humidesulfovibrio idahonensis]